MPHVGPVNAKRLGFENKKSKSVSLGSNSGSCRHVTGAVDVLRWADHCLFWNLVICLALWDFVVAIDTDGRFRSYKRMWCNTIRKIVQENKFRRYVPIFPCYPIVQSAASRRVFGFEFFQCISSMMIASSGGQNHSVDSTLSVQNIFDLRGNEKLP